MWYSINIMRNNERENMLNVILTKDMFIPSTPWRLDLVTPKGKTWLSSHPTKSAAIACVKDCSSTAVITDKRTGKVL